MVKPPMRPQIWHPPPAPERARQLGPSAVSLRIIDLPGAGPEDVVVDGAGRAIVGLADGRILRIEPDSGRVHMIADTEGRPLGIELDAGGDLVVCDARRGVLSVAPESGRVTSMVSRIAGQEMLFCNNAAVGADGSVYFTDSSLQFGYDHWRGEILAHSGTGRLFRRSPDGRVDLLAEGLQFANGVALAPDGSFLAVAETSAYRVRLLWLQGPREGRLDTLVDNLPGFPDNISLGSDGLIWVALPSPRDRNLDALLPRAPVLRRAVWALPEAVQPKEKKTVWVQAYDLEGALVHDLQTSDPNLYMVTGVREVNGAIWVSSLEAPAIGVLTRG